MFADVSLPLLIGLIAALAGTGLVGGVLAGLLGVGGGIVIVPVLYNILPFFRVDDTIRIHVAIGTSLPELATSLIAAFRHQSDIAIGNIVGSNIFNVLGILGVTSIVAPIPVAPRFLTFDLPIMIVVSIVLTGLLLLHQKIGRRTGAVMLLAYCAYLLTAH